MAGLPEENFVAWEQRGECLCGCGGHPKSIKGRLNAGYSFWMIGHQQSTLKAMGIKRPNGVEKRGPDWIRSVREANAKRHYVNAVWIAHLVEEHIEASGLSLTKWAKVNGFEPEWVRKVVRRQRSQQRITQDSANRLLTAIGEKTRRAAA